MIEKMITYKASKNIQLDNLNLDFEQFNEVISASENLPLLTKIFRNEMIIPEFSTFCESITMLYHKLRNNFDGEVVFNCNDSL